MLLIWFSCSFFVYFVCICCLSTTQFSLVIFSQISVNCSKSSYWIPEVYFTSFWLYHHWLWWISWYNVDIISFIHILVWIFKGHGFFQVTRTNASYVLYIICFQLIALSKSGSILSNCTWFISVMVFMQFCFPHDFACFWLSFIVFLHQHLVWDSLTCTKLALKKGVMSFCRWWSLLLRL